MPNKSDGLMTANDILGKCDSISTGRWPSFQVGFGLEVQKQYLCYMETVTRRCTRCQDDLPATDEFFAKRYDRSKPLFQSMCRTCQAEYRKEHYEKNKQKYINKAAAYTEKFKVWFTELKSTMKCKLCPESRWWVLDFHHRDPAEKEEELSTLIRKCSKKKIEAELAKCDVLCANCHRDLHHQERQAVIG